jgi:hypothetical protein
MIDLVRYSESVSDLKSITRSLCDQAKYRKELQIKNEGMKGFAVLCAPDRRLSLIQRVATFIKSVFLAFNFRSIESRIARQEAWTQAFTGRSVKPAEEILLENIRKITDYSRCYQKLNEFACVLKTTHPELANKALEYAQSTHENLQIDLRLGQIISLAEIDLVEATNQMNAYIDEINQIKSLTSLISLADRGLILAKMFGKIRSTPLQAIFGEKVSDLLIINSELQFERTTALSKLRFPG